MSVWLSTTMIQALRDLVDLYTFYYDILERFLDGLMDLLCVCICQGWSMTISCIYSDGSKQRMIHLRVLERRVSNNFWRTTQQS